MATQYDIVKAYADLYYENASVKKDIIVLGFQFGPVNIRFAFKFDERGNIKNPGFLLMNDVYLLRPDVNASQKEDFLNSFGEDCYLMKMIKLNFLSFLLNLHLMTMPLQKYICMDARHWKELILY